MANEKQQLRPAAAYEHAHLIARDLVADIAGQLDEAMRPDDRNLRWRHAHAMNRINALLSQAAEAVDELNNRNR